MPFLSEVSRQFRWLSDGGLTWQGKRISICSPRTLEPVDSGLSEIDVHLLITLILLYHTMQPKSSSLNFLLLRKKALKALLGHFNLSVFPILALFIFLYLFVWLICFFYHRQLLLISLPRQSFADVFPFFFCLIVLTSSCFWWSLHCHMLLTFIGSPSVHIWFYNRLLALRLCLGGDVCFSLL